MVFEYSCEMSTASPQVEHNRIQRTYFQSSQASRSPVATARLHLGTALPKRIGPRRPRLPVAPRSLWFPGPGKMNNMSETERILTHA